MTDETTDSTGQDVILRTEELTKQFGGLVAVDHVDFSLPANEIHCLIGPNGAGKSTFFKMLVGRHSPSSGRVLFKGEDITNLPPHERVRRGLSMKFQDVSVYPNLSVKENVRIPVQRYYEKHEVNDEIEEILQLIRLDGRGDEIVDNLSHGEQQWLEIAMATAVNPEVLLLDEPTAGMTIEETEDTGNFIETLADRGMTVIVVEHDINFVRQIAEEVTVLHDGRIFAQGSVSEIEADEDVQRIYLGQEE